MSSVLFVHPGQNLTFGIPLILSRHTWIEDDQLVLTIASRLRDGGLDDTAERLETAYDRETAVLALSISAHDDILQVLVDCPEGLCELRAVLLKQRAWCDRGGIS
jgi:hypothetical protein